MAPAMARFEVVAGRALGMSILLDDELLIGRHADGAGRLADDDEISRSHARISLDRSGFCAIEDLGSTNGTFVNGLRIDGPQTLSVGDTIEVGGTVLVLRELPPPGAERLLKAVSPPSTVAPRERPATASISQETPAATIGSSGRPQRSLRRPQRPPAPQASAQRPAPAPAPPGTEAAPASPGTDAAPASAPSTLSLSLHVDFGAREATVTLDEDGESIRLVFDGNAWRPAGS